MVADALSFDISKTAKKNLERLRKRMDPKEIDKRLFEFLDFEAGILAGKVVKETLSGGEGLNRRTGNLARSTVGRAVRISGVPAMRIGVFRGPSLAYAGIHESGGEIKPKKAKALAIPVGEAVDPSGVERFGGPRNFPGELRFLPFRRGIAVGKLIDEKDAKKLEARDKSPYEAQALYLLLKKVRIPASHWLSNPVTKALPTVARSIGGFFARLLRGEV